MNNNAFIARQRIKYYWKTLKHTKNTSKQASMMSSQTAVDPFWDYEKTPRVVV